MANPIVQQINTELEILKSNLSEFKSTVTYLNNAKDNMANAIETLNGSEKHFDKKVEELKKTYNAFINLTNTVSDVILKIDTINFPERLDSIEATVQETVKQINDVKKETLIELQKASLAISKADFDGKFDKLQKEISVSVKSNIEISKSIEKQNFGEKIEKFEKLISKGINESFKEVTKNTNAIANNTTKTIQDLNLPIHIDTLNNKISKIEIKIKNLQSRLDIVEKSIGDKIKDSADRQVVLILNLENQILNLLKRQKNNNYITWLIFIIITFACLFFIKTKLRR